MMSSTATTTSSVVTVKRSRRRASTSSTRISGALALHHDGARAAGAFRHFPQPHAVGGIRRAHHHEQPGPRGDGLDRRLPVGGGVADVFLARPDHVGEAALQGRDDLGGVVHGKGGLGGEGQRAVGRHHRLGIGHGLDDGGSALGQLAHGADDLGVALMADQQDMAAGILVALSLAMHLADQRAGGVQIHHVAAAGLGGH
jgi:hypothetical protein